MSQYRVGTVKCLSGETVVEGLGTLWLTHASVGDLFKLRTESVIYEVSGIDDDTHLHLTGAYSGENISGELYLLARDFTPYFNFPEINAGDVDWPYLVTKALRMIDTKLASMSGEI